MDPRELCNQELQEEKRKAPEVRDRNPALPIVRSRSQFPWVRVLKVNSSRFRQMIKDEPLSARTPRARPSARPGVAKRFFRVLGIWGFTVLGF